MALLINKLEYCGTVAANTESDAKNTDEEYRPSESALGCVSIKFTMSIITSWNVFICIP